MGAVIALSVLVGGCNRPNSHANAPAKTNSSVPKRIVSLTPSNTEILFALGLGNKIVGDTSYCNYPLEAKKKPKIGDMNVSIEKVVALKPDLVLAHAKLNSNVIQRLEGLNVPVMSIDPKTLPEVISSIKLVGNRTGASKRANVVAKKMELTIASVKKESASKPKSNVLVVVQSNPLWVAGPDTFVDEMISIVNGENVAHDGKAGFNTFSMETAIARDPDVIVVTNPQDKNFMQKNALWARTKAVKSGKLVYIDPDLLFRPGPRLTDGLKEMEKAVYGG